ncbi:flagellar biosynthetic protein FliR [Polynucleobacter paneuropaeus]|jgi:flagellar biosynthetic protein FliR|nr:flagellar biosynthetic protein FliR [Polynucleobacter paneuropaeus]
MLTLNSDLIQAWVVTILIPLVRILGFVAIAPFFGNQAISMPIKVAMGILLAMMIAPAAPAMPTVDLLSLRGILIIAEQMIIGLAIGLMMQIIFSAIEMAGQISGMTMGFGFATNYDPQSAGSTIVISQLMGILALLVFLSMNGHLIMISALLESFYAFPVTAEPRMIDGMTIAIWGAKLFSISLQLSLPIVATLLITNLALGILTKSSPQLNIFGIGFPITLCVGFVVIMLMLPTMAAPYQYILEQGMAASKTMLKFR